MVNENEYSDILRLIAQAEPMFLRWAEHRTDRMDALDMQERMRQSLADFLVGQITALEERNLYVC